MFGAENNINRTRLPGFPPYSIVPSKSKWKCYPAKFSDGSHKHSQAMTSVRMDGVPYLSFLEKPSGIRSPLSPVWPLDNCPISLVDRQLVKRAPVALVDKDEISSFWMAPDTKIFHRLVVLYLTPHPFPFVLSHVCSRHRASKTQPAVVLSADPVPSNTWSCSFWKLQPKLSFFQHDQSTGGAMLDLVHPPRPWHCIIKRTAACC